MLPASDHAALAEQLGAQLSPRLNQIVQATTDVPHVLTAPAPVFSLTQTERQALALIAEGKTNNGIAEALFLSINTVKTHVNRIYQNSE